MLAAIEELLATAPTRGPLDLLHASLNTLVSRFLDFVETSFTSSASTAEAAYASRLNNLHHIVVSNKVCLSECFVIV